ncbi:MAG: VOC family protein [Sphingobium sp.]
MIGYVTVGTNDLARAAQFYDGLLDHVGEKRLIDTAGLVGWGKSWEQPIFAVATTTDGSPATPGHGAVVALVQGSRKAVDRLHAKALGLGAVDDGAPASRGEEGDQIFYAGYVRDLDGNRLCLFHLGEKS